MFSRRNLGLAIGALVSLYSRVPWDSRRPRKPHVVVLGAAKRVPYSKAGDPAGAAAAEDALKFVRSSSMGRSRNGPPATPTM